MRKLDDCRSNKAWHNVYARFTGDTQRECRSSCIDESALPGQRSVGRLHKRKSVAVLLTIAISPRGLTTLPEQWGTDGGRETGARFW